MMERYIWPSSPQQVLKWQEKRRAEIIERNQMTHEQLIDLCRTQAHPNWRLEEMEYWAEAKSQLSPYVANTEFRLHGQNLSDLFEKITCPVLILKADADEEEKNRHREIASGLRNGTLVHINGAGHNVRRDQPKETVKVLGEFLASLQDAKGLP